MPRGVFVPKPRDCVVCGTVFTATNAMSRYCSELCNFQYYVGPETDAGCREWQGAIYKDGYGAFWSKRAHRVAWEVSFGPIPAGLGVLHACDNPKCVNPAHLMLGTPTANMADRDRKMRHAHGERSNTAKLTEADVVAIRRRLEAGEFAKDIAAEYEVGKSQVDRIARGEAWGHMADAGPIPRRSRFKLADHTEQIRAEYRRGRGSPTNSNALARRYGVGPGAILEVVHGTHYRKG